MDNTTGDPALETALFMAELGARVFPISSGRKTPIFSKWPERATTDPDIIRGWAEQNPGCNWAMVCERIRVLDVDNHGGDVDGHNALASLEEEHGKIETWMAHPWRWAPLSLLEMKADISVLARDGLELRGDGH